MTTSPLSQAFSAPHSWVKKHLKEGFLDGNLFLAGLCIGQNIGFSDFLALLTLLFTKRMLTSPTEYFFLDNFFDLHTICSTLLLSFRILKIFFVFPFLAVHGNPK